MAGLPVNAITSIGWAMAAAWLAFLGATIWWFPEPPPARLPIGLARESMLLPQLGSGTVSPSQIAGSTVSASRASSAGSLGPPLAASLQQQGRPGSDNKQGLHRPLLETVHSGMQAEELEVAATVAAAAAADVEAAAEPAALEASQPLLPHAQRAQHAQQQQQAALQRGKGGKRAAAGWRATVPGTLACTLALLVQKMVRRGGIEVRGKSDGASEALCSVLLDARSHSAHDLLLLLSDMACHVMAFCACRCSRRTWTAFPCSPRCC